jgi:hypothetical protein
VALFARYDSDEPRPPLSEHPAFPALVAAWFAALLGFGTFILPAALIETAVGATGIAAIFPPAAPPLGMTARALIALCAALAGGAAGLYIARRVAAAHAVDRAGNDDADDLPWPRPLSVREDVSGEGVINGRGLPVTNRRALAIAEDDDMEDFLYVAPLPGRASAQPEPEPAPEPAGEEPHPEASIPAESESPAPHWRDADAELPLTALAQRLAASLKRRREMAAGSEPAAPQSLGIDLDVAAADDAAQAMAAYFGRSVQVAPAPQPSPEPAAQAEADAALRAALATLRRTRGTAA